MSIDLADILGIDWDQLYPFFLIALYLLYFFFSAKKKTNKASKPMQPRGETKHSSLNSVLPSKKKYKYQQPQTCKPAPINPIEQPLIKAQKESKKINLKKAVIYKTILDSYN